MRRRGNYQGQGHQSSYHQNEGPAGRYNSYGGNGAFGGDDGYHGNRGFSHGYSNFQSIHAQGQGGGMGGQGGAEDNRALMMTIQQLQKKVEQLATQTVGGGGQGGGGMMDSRFGGGFGPGFGGGNQQSGAGFGDDSGGRTGFDRGSRVAPKRGPVGTDDKKGNKLSDVDEKDPHKGEQRVVLVNNIPMDLALPKIIYEEMSHFGEVQRIKILHNNRTTALVQMKNAEEAQCVVDGQDHLNRNGFRIYANISTKFTEVPMPAPGSMQDDGLTADYTGRIQLNTEPRWQKTYQMDQMMQMGPGGMGPGAVPMMYMDDYEGKNNLVVLVSNLPDELAQVDRIFNIMGVYGDVLCVKILFQKRDCALVHMSRPHHAAQAKQHLDQFKVGGKNLTLSYSKIRTLLANKLIDEDGLQKQFVQSKLHRFKNQQQVAKITKNMGPPTNILHVSNFPETFTHEDIKEMFIENGFTAKESRECEGKTKMCYLIFSSPDEALMALAVMHNHSTDELKSKNGKGLCVSFTNNLNKPGQHKDDK